MNAAIQCGIVGCERLDEYFETHSIGARQNDGQSTSSISKSIAWLLAEISNIENRNTIYPAMVKSAIDTKLPRYKGTEQNDCSEFLMDFLDALHVELNSAICGTGGVAGSAVQRSTSFSMLTRSASSIAAMNGSISGKSISSINWRSKGDQWWAAMKRKDDSVVKDLFEGAIRSVMTCSVCGGISARFETFSQLILPLPSGSFSRRNFPLKKILNDLFAPESIDGIDCDYCKRKRLFERTIDIWKLPPYLIITLNRFSFSSSAQKNNIPIDVDKKKIYSIDKSLWGISIECGNLEDPNSEPLDNSYISVKKII
jgi:ubiquitin C-terminal hydrolase